MEIADFDFQDEKAVIIDGFVDGKERVYVVDFEYNTSYYYRASTYDMPEESEIEVEVQVLHAETFLDDEKIKSTFGVKKLNNIANLISAYLMDYYFEEIFEDHI